jgi:hypothetical protein
MKIRDVHKPFNSLLELVAEHSMATVVEHLSVVARFVAEELTDEDCQGKDLDRSKSHCERLHFDLSQLSQREERFMNGTSEPIDKQGLN